MKIIKGLTAGLIFLFLCACGGQQIKDPLNYEVSLLHFKTKTARTFL